MGAFIRAERRLENDTTETGVNIVLHNTTLVSFQTIFCEFVCVYMMECVQECLPCISPI